MINKHYALFLYLGSSALFALAADVQADGERIQWKNNLHFYQRFDQPATWANAKANCEAKSAHLATITNANEQGFIQNNLLTGLMNPSQVDLFIGGIYQSFKWQWITGEKWNYTNWLPGSPTGGDYIAFNPNPNYHFGTWWNAGSTTELGGYICEWSTNNYIGLATVPDMNNNGSDEIAALYVDYVTSKHTVKIRDPKTDTVLSTLTFKNGLAAPQGIVALEDLNSNGMSEIGVLYSEFGQPSVLIKDAKDNKAYLNSVRFLTNGFNPKQITVSPDTNGNGSSEITVLGIGKTNNNPKAETRDSSTGALLNDTAF